MVNTKVRVVMLWQIVFSSNDHRNIPIPDILLIIWPCHFFHLALGLCSLTMNPGGPVWLSQPAEYSRSDSLWLLRLDYKSAMHSALCFEDTCSCNSCCHHAINKPTQLLGGTSGNIEAQLRSQLTASINHKT